MVVLLRAYVTVSCPKMIVPTGIHSLEYFQLILFQLKKKKKSVNYIHKNCIT